MIITIFGSILLVILLIYFAYQTKLVREKAYQELLNKKTLIYTACAGTDDQNKVIPATKEIKALDHSVFKDKEGKVLCPDDYAYFIVQGESMQFCGIHNNDLIFADTQFQIAENTMYPIVLVLRKHHAEEGSVQYKIRRTWMRYTYTTGEDLINAIKRDILSSVKFQEIKQLGAYDGDEALIRDLKDERINQYEKDYINCNYPNPKDREIVISTTFHTRENRIRFSLHPVSTIEGKVVASFHL